MRNLIRKYRAGTFEEKMVVKAIIGLCFSAVLACGKFVIGLIVDYNLIIVALYTFGILLAKFECVLGTKSEKMTFKTRNNLVGIFLLISSLIYIAFTSSMFFVERKVKNNATDYVLILTFICFVELGFAIAGLFRTKDRGHFYRDIKIINFCAALIAILTAQMAIRNMVSGTGTADIYNAYTGIGVGVFISLCAIYILVAPYTSHIGREHNSFVLRRKEENFLVDMSGENFELPLCRSFTYGDYIYRAKIEGDMVDGSICRGKSLWKRMHWTLKIVCCILSEILVFLWLIGRLVLFFRSIDLPKRLERKMIANGFEKI